VTGASGGIGRAVAGRLAAAGAFVCVNYSGNAAAAQETLESVREAGSDGALFQFDVRDSRAVDSALDALIKEKGALDILINNAGIASDGLLGRMKDSQWNDVIEVNLTGAFHVSRAAAKHMIRKRAGRIVHITSTAGETGNAGQANYSAAKAGLIGFTKAMARELAPRNILVNAVSPGLIAGGMSEGLNEMQIAAITEQIPLRRMGLPEEVASVVLFLCSAAATYVTGQVIRVNGGLYM
jgi:3-oxoacyl-[acyl-carrier protein] reductase